MHQHAWQCIATHCCTKTGSNSIANMFKNLSDSDDVEAAMLQPTVQTSHTGASPLPQYRHASPPHGSRLLQRLYDAYICPYVLHFNFQIPALGNVYVKCNTGFLELVNHPTVTP